MGVNVLAAPEAMASEKSRKLSHWTVWTHNNIPTDWSVVDGNAEALTAVVPVKLLTGGHLTR